jgi:DNA-binding CsgD family transcriptional regulator
MPSSAIVHLMGEVRAAEVRQLLRAVAEAAELPAPDRAVHVLRGLRQLVGAVAAGCVTDCDFAPGSRGASTPVALDGWDSTTLKSIAVVAAEGSNFHPAVRALMAACPMKPGAILTRTRRGLIDDREWYGSPFVEGHLLPTGLDDGLFSSLRGSPPSIVVGVGLYRERRDKPFSERDRALLELFHVECGRLCTPPPTAINSALATTLTPRERETLALLLEGRSDKDIAERLDISPFTVNQYNKSIFRRFGVRSRAALLAKLLQAITT